MVSLLFFNKDGFDNEKKQITNVDILLNKETTPDFYPAGYSLVIILRNTKNFLNPKLRYLTAYKVHFLKYNYHLRFSCVVYAIWRFKIRDSWLKLSIWQLLLA